TSAALLPHCRHLASGRSGLCVSDCIDAGREPAVELPVVGQHTIVEPAAAQLRRTNRAVGLAVVADSAWHFAGCMEPPDGSGYGAEPAVVCVAGNPPSVAVRAGCRCGGPAAVPGYVRRRTLHLLGRVAGACRNGTDVGQLARQPQPVPRRHGAVAGGGGETVPDRHGRPDRLMARGVVYGAGSGAAGAGVAASAVWGKVGKRIKALNLLHPDQL